MNTENNNLTPEQREELLVPLKTRFEKHMARHKGLEWAQVLARLKAQPEKLWSLSEMERTGGEPDVVDRGEASGEFIFVDCSPESPEGGGTPATTRKRWKRGRNSSPSTAPWSWLRRWASRR